MIKAATNGVHTYSAGMVLTYEQYKKIWKACSAAGCIEETSDVSDAFKKKESLYCYAYQKQGVKLYLNGKSGELYRLRVQIEPCRVLDESDPTALSIIDRNTYKRLVTEVDKMLKKLKVPCSVDEMKISRCDLTVNVEYAKQNELMEYLRIIKKSLIPSHYVHTFFNEENGTVKDDRTANAHSYCLSCKSANFLVYDKIAQLRMINRCDEALLKKHILRFEAELKRPALKNHLGKAAMKTNYKLLFEASKKCRKVVDWYLHRLQPECEGYLRYEDAVDLVENANASKKIRARMLYLMRKTSDKKSLAAALDAMQEKFQLSRGQCNTVLKKFRKLGISPITLTNSSKFDELPALDMSNI